MNWFHNLKISRKLLGSFLLLALIIVAQGIYSLNSAEKINESVGELYDNRLLPAVYLSDVGQSFNHLVYADMMLASSRNTAVQRELRTEIQADMETVQRRFSQYSDLLHDDREKVEIESFRRDVDKYLALRSEFTQLLSVSPDSARSFLLSEEFTGLVAKIEAEIDKLSELQGSIGKEFHDNSQVLYDETRNVMVLVIVISVFLSVSLGIFISRVITLPLFNVTEISKKIAMGDLSDRLVNNSKDEIGELTRNINLMADQLTGLISQIKRSSQQVASAADEISASSVQVSRSAESQSSAADETSSTIVEIASQIETVAKTTQALASNVNEIASTVDQMSSNTTTVATKVNQVNDFSKQAVQKTELSGRELKEVIRRIETKSSSVEDIISVIEDIADQTNLLALNASIEAAWAGEAGKGFAVVADAIRNLAEKSISATKEISSVVYDMKRETGDAVQKTEAIVSEIVTNVSQTSSMLNEVTFATQQQSVGASQIVKSVDYMNKMTQEVANATKEQQNGGNMIIKAVDNISIASRQNLQAVTQMSKAASDLAGEADLLKNQVEKFRLA
ncbi:MAG: methyl-accepting chemotaxis protein [Bacteroidetes bacterium]|nr:methyl-accepting chemotaxis protein [Bacteroidota bacterium]